MATRAVFDANVLISGLVFEGVPGRCLDALEAGEAECVTCGDILADVVEKLRTKFRHGDEQLAEETAWLVTHTQTIVAPGHIRGVCRDPDDDVVIECAVVGGAEFVVTGDSDLLEVGVCESVRIVTPVQFLAALRQQSL